MLKPFSVVVANVIDPSPDDPNKAIVELQQPWPVDPNAPAPPRRCEIRLTVDRDELDTPSGRIAVGRYCSVGFS